MCLIPALYPHSYAIVFCRNSCDTVYIEPIIVQRTVMSDTLEDLEPIDSPCQLVCSMDKESGHCFGCGRTQDEIAYWTLKTPEERMAILAELEGRMPPLRIKLEERRSRRRVNKRRRPTANTEGA